MDWLKELLKDLPNAADLEKSITKGIGESFVSKADFNTVNDTKKQLETDIKDRNTQLETLKSTAGDAEALKAQITQLQAENSQKDEEYQTQLKDVQLSSAIKLAIAGKAHDEDLVSGLVDKSKLILGEDGKIVGLEDQITSLKEGKAFLFKQEVTESNLNPTPGFRIGNPPATDVQATDIAIASAFGNTVK